MNRSLSPLPPIPPVARPVPPGRRGGLQGWRRKLTWLCTLPLLALCFGCLYQYGLSARDLHRYVPPGKLVAVDGHRMHLLISGEAKHPGEPTVVLETGLGGIAWCWSWVQPEVATFARVVSYDRAGLGWSDPDPHPVSPAHSAATLHAALAAAGIPGPYVLVGHSMGGLLVRVYNDLYPDEVAGIVLIEPCHPEQSQCNPFIRQATKQHMYGLKIRQVLTYIGYERGFGDYFDLNAKGMPKEGLEQARTVLSLYRHVKWTNKEAAMWDSLCAYVSKTPGVGDKPLMVVTGDQGLPPGFLDLEADLARLSSQGKMRLIRGGGHLNLVGEQENALKVVQAIREVQKQAAAWLKQRAQTPDMRKVRATATQGR